MKGWGALMSALIDPVFIALGSNLGDSTRHIRDAIAALSDADGFEVTAVAPLYESAPMYVEDQPVFVNTCLMGRTTLSADGLLALLKKVETEIGRKATFRNGPRVIDLDIVFYGSGRICTENLTVPHPRRRERLFVLQPIADIAPDFRDPESGETMAVLLAAMDGPPLSRLA